MQEGKTLECAGFRISLRERVATMTLDRPPVNVLDIRTLQEMADVARDIAKDPHLSALVLTGAGKAFCAGVDVSEHRPETVVTMLHAFDEFCRILLDYPKPTLARVQGAALGGGCELVLCCDRAVAAASARLGLPEVTLGVFPPVAAVLLPRLAGRRAAAEAILWGEILSAESALRIGLVTEVVPEAGLDGRVSELAGRVARLSCSTLRLTREALHRGADGSIAEALRAAERSYLDHLMATEDASEGLSAFLEKRPPVWRHR